MFNPDSAESWVFYSDNSYLVTRLLWFTGFMMEPPVSAHRTIELFLKAYLVSKGNVIQKGQPAWGHELSKLLDLCAMHDETFSISSVRKRVGFLQRYFDFIRYPSSIEAKRIEGGLLRFGSTLSILPFDEVVAFIRPRILLPDSVWLESRLTFVYNSTDPVWGYQKKALTDANEYIQQIVCSATNSPDVRFDDSFRWDLHGC